MKRNKPDNTNYYLTCMAEMLNHFRKLHQLHNIEIAGMMLSVTCPFCGRKNFNLSPKTMSGNCGTCRQSLADYREYEKYYLIYLEHQERTEGKRTKTLKHMMEHPGDVIYPKW